MYANINVFNKITVLYPYGIFIYVSYIFSFFFTHVLLYITFVFVYIAKYSEHPCE